MMPRDKKIVKFYFDFISPYAWLAWRPLINALQKHSSSPIMPGPISFEATNQKKNITFEAIPVLFAGLLNHHGQLGPAEIPSKRVFIFKDIVRRAKLQNLKVNPPPTHPFNPLLSLRIASLDYPSNSIKYQVIGRILDAVWSEGRDVSDEKIIRSILREFDLNDEEYLQRSKEPILKEKLKNQTNEAISCGVFGVPTTLIDDELFWGSEIETFQMIDYALQDHPMAKIDSELIERWIHIKKSADRRHLKE